MLNRITMSTKQSILESTIKSFAEKSKEELISDAAKLLNEINSVTSILAKIPLYTQTKNIVEKADLVVKKMFDLEAQIRYARNDYADCNKKLADLSDAVAECIENSTTKSGKVEIPIWVWNALIDVYKYQLARSRR